MGETFDAATVNIVDDTIQFARNHDLNPGDAVIYDDGGGVSVGGLVSGDTYYVRLVDDRTIRLASSAAAEFVPTDLNGSTIQITDHGFQNGDVVIYSAPAPTEFARIAVDEGNRISMANHGFSDGEEVVYTIDGSGNPIGPLVDGGTYFVKWIDDATIQLAATAGGEALILDTSGTEPTTIHRLMQPGDKPLGNLGDGNTYYVINRTNDAFQLAATPGGPAITPDPTGITGTHYISLEGIDLTSAGSGIQTLHFDLTGGATGDSHELLGIGGLLSSPSGSGHDGVSTALATASSGGLIDVEGATTTPTVAPSLSLLVGAEARITSKGDVRLESTSVANAKSRADNTSGGAVGVGSAVANAAIEHSNKVTLAQTVEIHAAGTLEILAQSSNTSEITADSNGAGGYDHATAKGTAQVDYTTEVSVGGGANLTADTIRINSQTETSSTGWTDPDASGFAAGAKAETRLFTGSPDHCSTTTTTIGGSGTQLKAKTVDVAAINAGHKLDARAIAAANAVGAGCKGVTEVKTYDTTEVLVQNGASVTGNDALRLHAEYQSIDVNAYDKAILRAIGKVESTATNSLITEAKVTAEDGAELASHNLQVNALTDVDRCARQATEAYVSWKSIFTWKLKTRSGAKAGDFLPKRTIDLNADVVVLGGAAPELVIDSSGAIERACNITVNSGQSSGVVVGDVSVDDIMPGSACGMVIVQADTRDDVGTFDGQTAQDSAVSGTNSTYHIQDALENVKITNRSLKNLTINDIGVLIDGGGDWSVTLDADSVTHEFCLVHTSTLVEIQNLSSSELTLVGLIDNPRGTTHIVNSAGDILNGKDAAATVGVVRTNFFDAETPQGTIGSDTDPVNVEMVRIAGRPTQAFAKAGEDVFLSLTGRLREPGVAAPQFHADTIRASRNVDLLLREGLADTGPTGAGAGVTVTVVHEGHSAEYFSYFRPDLPTSVFYIDPGIGAAPTATPIASTYDLEGVVAGGNIVITAAKCEAADTSVGVRGNTDILDAGRIDVFVNGEINLTESNGDMRVGTINSTASDVTLTASDSGSSVCDRAIGKSTVPHILGNSITLNAPHGGVGTAANPLDIDSSRQAAGRVNVIAHDSIFAVETEGDLNIGSIASLYSDVMLATLNGSMLDGDADDKADIQGADIDLMIEGGGIGADTNDVEIYGAGAGQQQNTLQIDPAAPGLGRLFLDAEGSIYVTEVNGSLRALKVTSQVGAIRLTVNDSASDHEDLSLIRGGSTQLGTRIAKGLISAPQAVTVMAGDDVKVPVGTLITAPVCSYLWRHPGNGPRSGSRYYHCHRRRHAGSQRGDRGWFGRRSS